MADQPDNDAPDAPENADEQATEVVVAATDGGDTVAADTQTPEAEPAQTASSPAASAPAAASEPAEQLSPKERRRKARAARAGAEARPSRSPEERHAERVAARRDKAARRRRRRLQERAKAAERRAAAPAPEPLAPVHAAVEGVRRERQGIVVSDKAEKTIVVRIDTARRHRRYEKIVRSSSTLHAHDENNDAHEGDVVRVVESRPLSRTKRWALVDVLERAR
jgi:small subunit ribosomal protein S17